MFSVDKAAAVNEKKNVEIELHLSKAKHSLQFEILVANICINCVYICAISGDIKENEKARFKCNICVILK